MGSVRYRKSTGEVLSTCVIAGADNWPNLPPEEGIVEDVDDSLLTDPPYWTDGVVIRKPTRQESDAFAAGEAADKKAQRRRREKSHVGVGHTTRALLAVVSDELKRLGLAPKTADQLRADLLTKIDEV